jgi:hypothetical protein
MEYSKLYDINRRMHARPYADVLKSIYGLRRENEGLTIELEEPKSGRIYVGESFLELLILGGSFIQGGKVRITAKGNYTPEKLEEFTDEVGEIFAFKDTSRSTADELYKNCQGYYPDEGSKSIKQKSLKTQKNS